MKIILKFLSFLTLFIILIADSFAIEAPLNFKLDSSNNSSVTFSWDKVTTASDFYYIYYKNSSNTGSYDKQTVLIEGNTFSIGELNLGDTYEFVIVSIDDDGNESVYSNVIVANITNLIEPTFLINGIEVIQYNEIELSFSNNLDNSETSLREFKISNKNDIYDTFDVVNTELNKDDNSKIKLILDRDTTVGQEYEVVIIALTSIDGKNIESGIDNTEIFTVSEIAQIDLNAASQEAIVATGQLTGTSGIVAEEVGPTSVNVEASQSENTVFALSDKNNKLPQTGPEHILMLLLAFLLGSLIFLFKYKKI